MCVCVCVYVQVKLQSKPLIIVWFECYQTLVGPCRWLFPNVCFINLVQYSQCPQAYAATIVIILYFYTHRPLKVFKGKRAILRKRSIERSE